MNRFHRNVRPILWMLALIFLVVVPFYAGANGTLNLQKTAAFDKSLSVPDAIRTGCQLDSKLIDFIESSASADFEKIALVEDVSPNAAGRTLAVTITGLSGAGGGAWSGPKHLSIAGTLWKDGKVVGTFTAHRVTGGGMWGAYRGTCSLLGRCARALGKDVAGWLKNPTMGARLGDDQQESSPTVSTR